MRGATIVPIFLHFCHPRPANGYNAEDCATIVAKPWRVPLRVRITLHGEDALRTCAYPHVACSTSPVLATFPPTNCCRPHTRRIPARRQRRAAPGPRQGTGHVLSFCEARLRLLLDGGGLLLLCRPEATREIAAVLRTAFGRRNDRDAGLDRVPLPRRRQHRRSGRSARTAPAAVVDLEPLRDRDHLAPASRRVRPLGTVLRSRSTSAPSFRLNRIAPGM
jgi:hypothetical protein